MGMSPGWDVDTHLRRVLRHRPPDRGDEGRGRCSQAAILAIIKSWRPDLLKLTGVGPIVAATVLCAWSHPGRCRNDGAFANLAGVAPIPASSGLTTRHRLSRGGDRQLNRALHVIAMHRMRHDPDTRTYVARRRSEGRSDREIRRCLKRYIARQLYRQLQQPLDAQ
jgi:transposase